MSLATFMRIISQCLEHVRKCKWKKNPLQCPNLSEKCKQIWDQRVYKTLWNAVGRSKNVNYCWIWNSQSHSVWSLNTWLRLRRFGNFPAAPASCSSQTAFWAQPCTPKNLIRFVVIITYYTLMVIHTLIFPQTHKIRSKLMKWKVLKFKNIICYMKLNETLKGILLMCLKIQCIFRKAKYDFTSFMRCVWQD